MINTDFNSIPNTLIIPSVNHDEKEENIVDSPEFQKEMPEQIPLISGNSTVLFSIDQIRGFLEKLGLHEDKWNDYFLEDALIHQLFPVFEKEKNLSFMQVEAFFSLLAILKSSDYKNSEFSKVLKSFNASKSLSMSVEIQIGLLANARILLSRTLGDIFGNKGIINKEQSLFLSATTYSTCIHYMNQYTKQLTCEFDLMKGVIEKDISKVSKIFVKIFEDEKEINNFFHLMNIFKKRWNVVKEVLSHPLLLCKDSKEIASHGGELNSFIQSVSIYTNFLKKESRELIDYLEKAKKGFGYSNDFNSAVNILTHSVHNMQNVAVAVETLRLFNLSLLESLQMSQDPDDLELLMFSFELSMAITGSKPIEWTEKRCQLLQRALEKEPNLSVIFQNKKNIPKPDIINNAFQMDIEAILKNVSQKLESLHTWQTNFGYFFSELTGKYQQLYLCHLEEKQAMNDGKPLWLFLAHELVEEERIEKNKIKKVRKTTCSQAMYKRA